ncbi:serine/threonine protein kinase [Cytobacillus sp. Hz8]|uniref:serine/threonine protein kinase n=1 Tax=Cytobacillus sp. Hz8 TaxID=3347168 RepID=UPI0035D7028F
MMKPIFQTIFLRVTDFFDSKFQLGEKIDNRYQIQKFLGKGSYGYSYLVLDLQNGMEVVLKTLRLHKRLTKRGRKGFLREMEILNQFLHLQFPHFYERGIYQSIPYFTMEYMKGRTFEQLIFQDGKVFTEREAFQKGLELLSLMRVLHQKGIIHRDIRIPNVILDDGQLKLIDFGLAAYIEDVPNKSKWKTVRRAANPLSDYYALGHFLLFLLYSQYDSKESKKEQSWEVELQISEDGKQIIKRLLLTSIPYNSIDEIEKDIIQIIAKNGRNEDVVI